MFTLRAWMLLSLFSVLFFIQGLSSVPMPSEQSSENLSDLKPLGAPDDIDINDPNVIKFADQSLLKYSADYEKTYKPLVSKIHSAKKQLVSGDLYIIRVTFGESNCLKESKETCILKENGESEECTVEAWLQVWIKPDPEITVKCAKE